MSAGNPRSLPIRVPPLAGEALDSWFDALAHRLHVPVADLLPPLGLPRAVRRGADRALDIPADWSILLRPAEVARIAAATAVPADTITAMTLAVYDQRAVLIDTATRRVNIRSLWGRGTGSRYCPDCLTETGGRWRLSWKLNWSFACLTHCRLLADRCPDCDRAQRTRTSGEPEPPRPGRCAHPVDPRDRRPLRRWTGVHIRCHADLSNTATLPLPAGHPALQAQQLLDDLFASDVADFGVYTDRPQPAITALADIRSIAGRTIAYLQHHDPAGILPADPITGQLLALARHQQQRMPARTRQRLGTVAPASAAGTAIGVLVACTVLASANVHQAGEALQPLIVTPRGPKALVTCPSTVDDWGRTTSTVLHSIALAALGPGLRPTDQLRYRTAAPHPRQPDTPTADLRARKIPTLLWPYWATRLNPANNAYARRLRPALSAALLLAGTRLELADAAHLLGGATTPLRISTTVQMLHATPCWPDICAGLDRLVDYLDTHDVPIDYQRRRQTDYRRLLPAAGWRRICREAGTTPGPAIRSHIARCVLFEQLSGMPPHLAPFSAGTTTPDFRTKTVQFGAVLTPALAAGLIQAAATFLHQQGITDEPLTWQPPASLLDGLDLPGPDPHQIDLPRLHHLVRIDQISIPTAARHIGVTTAAAHALLLDHPAPPRPRFTPPPDRRPAKQLLPPEVLARLHLDRHLSLAHIDQHTGFSRGTAARLAHDYAIPIRGGVDDALRTHPALPRDWLFDQHVTHERSLADLAREKQLSKSTVRHWAKIYDVPIQRHRPIQMNIPAAAAAPPLLRPAITGPNAWQRLHRFAEATRHPTFRQAATALDIDISALIDHINRLEREFDQPLLERAGPRRTTQPTPFGRKVISTLRTTKRANPPK